MIWLISVVHFVHREICIEFNHSQLDYYTELDAVSMVGILKYPENGELEILSISLDTHAKTGYVFDNNVEEDKKILSDIRIPSASNVICFIQTSLLKLIICGILDTFVNKFRSIYEIDQKH